MQRVIEHPTFAAPTADGGGIAFKRVETLVDDAAAARPDHLALRFVGRSWTYGPLRAETDRRAALPVAVVLAPGNVALTAPIVSDTAAELQPLARRATARRFDFRDALPHSQIVREHLPER